MLWHEMKVSRRHSKNVSLGSIVKTCLEITATFEISCMRQHTAHYTLADLSEARITCPCVGTVQIACTIHFIRFCANLEIWNFCGRGLKQQYLICKISYIGQRTGITQTKAYEVRATCLRVQCRLSALCLLMDRFFELRNVF